MNNGVNLAGQLILVESTQINIANLKKNRGNFKVLFILMTEEIFSALSNH